MRILLFLLLLSPVFASAQILRAYGVIEVGSLPTSSATGPKFAYNPADSSFYRWSHGSVWVKIIEPSITSDTIFITDQIGTSYVVSGDTINLTPYLLKSDTTAMLVNYIERGDTASMLLNYPSTAGYGIIDGGKTWRVDTTSPNGLATRLFAKTLPTTIAANYAAVSNGTNLIARNLFDNNTYAGVISRPWKFGEYTTAGLPTGVTGYTVYSTTLNGIGWYDGTRWNYVPKADRSAFTSTYIPFANSSGQFTESANFTFSTPNLTLGGSNPYIYHGGNILGVKTLTDAIQVLQLRGSATFGNRLDIFNAGDAVVGARIATAGGVDSYITTNLGLGTSTPARQLHVAGIARITGSTGTATTILGRDANGDLSNITAGTNLAIASGFLNLNLTTVGNTQVAVGTGTNIQGYSNFTFVDPNLTLGGSNPFLYHGGNSLKIKATTDAIQVLELRAGATTGNRIDIYSAGDATKSIQIANTTDTYFNMSSNFGIGNTAPARKLDVTGEIRASDLTTDPPTRLVGADADGDFGAATVGSGLTLSSSILRADTALLSTKYYADTKTSIPLARIPVGTGSGLTSYSNFNYVDGKKQLTLNGTWNGTSGVIASIGSQDSTQRTIFGFLNPLTYVERGSYFQAWGNQATVGGSPAGGIAEIVLDGTGNKNNPYFLVSGVRSGPFYQDLFRIDLNNGLNYVQMHGYGVGARDAGDLSKTQSAYIARFATDGTLLDLEQKRDTTIYIDDADYDFSAAITTAQISRRYNRVIFWMTTTAAAASDSELTLHTPDANLMQVEYLIHSVDEAGGFANVIRFGSNNAVDSTNGLVSSYFPAAGDGIHIRAGLRSSVYKYRYSN